MPHTSLLCSDSLVLNHRKDTTQIQNAKQKTNIYLSYLCLAFIVVTIPEGVRYPSGVQYLAPYCQTLVRLAVHAIGASDTLGLLPIFH